MPDDQLILDALRRHGVPFVVIGGHAVNYHGYGRTTEDADVVWVRTPESEGSLYRALTELSAAYIADEIDPATGVERLIPVTLPYIHSSPLMMLVTRHGFLDIFDYVPGFPEIDPNQLLASSVEAHGLRYVSLQWLRQLKRASGRRKDLLDLENLP